MNDTERQAATATAALDQMEGLLRDLARVLGTYVRYLQEAGFERPEALLLANRWQEIFWMRMFSQS